MNDNPSLTVDEILAILAEEDSLLRRIFSLQESMYKHTLDRNWEELQIEIESCGALCADFAPLDERLTAWLCGKSFYERAASYSANERKALSDAYRGVKTRFLRSKAENDRLSAYAAHMKGVVDNFLLAAFPHRRSKIYSRTGAVAMRGVESVVLDKTF